MDDETKNLLIDLLINEVESFWICEMTTHSGPDEIEKLNELIEIYREGK